LAFPGANFGLLSPVASLSAPLSASLPPSCCLSRKLSGLMPHPLCSLIPYAPSHPTLSRLFPLALLALVGSRSVPFWEPPREEETCKQYQRRADVDAFCCQPRSLDCIGAASAPHCVTRANCRSKCNPLPSCLIGMRDSSSSPRLLSFAPRHTHDHVLKHKDVPHTSYTLTCAHACTHLKAMNAFVQVMRQ
jgi:hypothetical protein